ncbi:stage II sporulation protein R [Ammonifex degensii KC4]|uniref:Stage II sporulation protein R n=1 Tax=Ammonifex degensii (strain DSM 10501 / KC4) TaxID=429009 RepID=C9R8L7_AMMDK|nr:stage II sporulation protein R [Ammonifex degensii]ACX52646.1 stage II sporulation protein R [Ammonifex degensii KC4]
MRRRWLILWALLSLGVGLITWGWYKAVAVKAYDPHNLIRIHIVANSDTPSDQALKYRVRDAIITAMAPEFQGVKEIETARQKVEANLEKIREVAQQEVQAAGKNYEVKVYHGYFDFPERSYGRLTLPAGEYEAVRVVLGTGQGQNWWCVLFPPLCLLDVENSPEGEGKGEVALRSRLYELARHHLFPPLRQLVQAEPYR